MYNVHMHTGTYSKINSLKELKKNKKYEKGLCDDMLTHTFLWKY